MTTETITTDELKALAEATRFEKVDMNSEDVLSDLLQASGTMERTLDVVSLLVSRFPAGRERALAWTKAQEMLFHLGESLCPVFADPRGVLG
jgi:hypothetical protein